MMALERKSYKEPNVSTLSSGHWEAAREGRLVLQQCRDCGQFVHYPSAICDRCLSEDLEWQEVSGLATVESHTTVYRAFSPDFAADVPYTVAVVRLDEGVNMLTWLIDVPPDTATTGMRVQVTFERISEEISLHRFRPVK